MAEPTKTSGVIASEVSRTQMGRSLVVKGELTGSEDLTISGQFEGTIDVQGHSVTIGP